jgi:hypothetical protein
MVLLNFFSLFKLLLLTYIMPSQDKVNAILMGQVFPECDGKELHVTWAQLKLAGGGGSPTRRSAIDSTSIILNVYEHIVREKALRQCGSTLAQ